MFKSLKAVILEKAKARVVLHMLHERGASNAALGSAAGTFINACNTVDAHIHRFN
jgi:hypothetical protein